MFCHFHSGHTTSCVFSHFRSRHTTCLGFKKSAWVCTKQRFQPHITSSDFRTGGDHWGGPLLDCKRCCVQTRALRWKKLKRVAPSSKMIKPADLGLITLFCSLDKLVHFAEKSAKVVHPVQKRQYLLISGWKRFFRQTEILCWKWLKNGAPSEKMTKRAALGLKKQLWTNWGTLLKIAKKCSHSAKMTKRADLRMKTLFYTNSCTLLKTLRNGVPRLKRTKHADLVLKTLFCKNSCTLLKKANKWCAQWENDKTCWSPARNTVL